MSLRTTISPQKRHGIVYTPRWIVDEILTRVAGGNLRGKTLCDPACGDGNFLTTAVEQRIAEGGDRRRLLGDLRNGFWGFDSDAAALIKCRARLNAVLRANSIRADVNWRLICANSADKTRMAEYFGTFDFVIGNPPYIRIQHLPQEMRALIAQHWPVAATGCCDLYMAFFALGLALLNPHGALGFITPNGYAKTAAGRRLRTMLATGDLIKTLVDFGQHQVFAGATTYPMITVLDKKPRQQAVRLYRYDGGAIHFCDELEPARLLAERWDLCSRREYARVSKIRRRGTPLCRIADIYVGVQTLADDVFILEQTDDDGDWVTGITAAGESVRLEKAVTLPILKVSVMKNGRDKKKRIIVCPYRYDSPVKSVLMSEHELRRRFPAAFAYLRAHRQRLLLRDKGEFRSPWFAFGRDINIYKTLARKIVTSGMNPSPNFMQCPQRHTFYSGYAIKIKNNAIGEDELLAQLNSPEMDFFIRRTGRDYRNGWKSYAKAFIKDFGVMDTAQLSVL